MSICFLDSSLRQLFPLFQLFSYKTKAKKLQKTYFSIASKVEFSGGQKFWTRND